MILLMARLLLLRRRAAVIVVVVAAAGSRVGTRARSGLRTMRRMRLTNEAEFNFESSGTLNGCARSRCEVYQIRLADCDLSWASNRFTSVFIGDFECVASALRLENWRLGEDANEFILREEAR